MIWTSKCKYTIFSKYLTLPMATLPILYCVIYVYIRVKSASIRYILSWQESCLPINY